MARAPAGPTRGDTMDRFRTARLSGALLSATLLASCATPPPDARSVLRQADAAMGASQLRSLAYAGTGTGTVFGQAWRAGDPWPRVTYSSYSRAIDYEAGAMREEFARSRAEPNG